MRHKLDQHVRRDGPDPPAVLEPRPPGRDSAASDQQHAHHHPAPAPARAAGLSLVLDGPPTFWARRLAQEQLVPATRAAPNPTRTITEQRPGHQREPAQPEHESADQQDDVACGHRCNVPASANVVALISEARPRPRLLPDFTSRPSTRPPVHPSTRPHVHPSTHPPDHFFASFTSSLRLSVSPLLLFPALTLPHPRTGSFRCRGERSTLRPCRCRSRGAPPPRHAQGRPVAPTPGADPSDQAATSRTRTNRAR